ncbi:MAG: FHA domain-containing protein, partial [Caldilineaceae bacterium]|nr:FHA domain-containing protein [Caldilineaceae bacterium]
IAIAGIAVDPPVSIRVRLLRAPNQLQEVNALVTELPCVIGRGDHCGVSLGKATSDKRVSREHAKLEKKDTELYLTDLGTVNGTYIDGKKLQQHKPTRLGKVSQVRLGPETTIEIETEL